mmetsp:Transcript_9272/g.12099  ORF Transcript_9272/g.12099 Transcript_9272/m.12099 type:complete len:364 (+) Transcript_9272:1837-2928(+)
MTDCHELTSCHQCGNVTGCHWCGDAPTGSCYSDSESFTCLWSTPCSELEKCLRKEPEFIGYGSNSVYIVNGFIAVCVVLLLSLGCTIVCSAFVSATSSVSYVEDDRYYELRDIEEDENENEDRSHDRDTNEHGNNDIIVLPENHTEWATHDDGWRYIPKISELNTPRNVKRCQRWTRILCLTFTVGVVISVVVLIFASPHFPEFAVCASELDWYSLMETFKNPTGAIQGNYILQASIYNPNKFDMSLVNCTGEFHFHNTLIGKFTIDKAHRIDGKQTEFIVPAGSTADILFQAKLNVPASSAVSMYTDYFYYETLKLRIKTETYVGVMAGNSISYHSFYSLPEEVIELTELDDHVCKCKLDNT